MASICNERKFTRRKSDNRKPKVALLQGLTLLGFILIFTFGKAILLLLDSSCICQ